MTDISQPPFPLTSAVREDMRHALQDALGDQRKLLFQELSELISFQSVHSVPGLEEDNAQAAQWVVDKFRELGIPVEPYVTSDGSTTVIGLKEARNGKPTVLLYSHFDVQPATDLENWTSSPWELTEREGRWYGRGAADCKGHVAMHLAVLRALNSLIDAGYEELDELGIRVLVEGSEERGGYGLEELLEEKPELFAADIFLIADSGNAAVGEPGLVTALRGSAPIDVELRTLEQPMHSGQFGGAAPDALLGLIQLLDSLTDEEGLLAVEGLRSSATWAGDGPSVELFRQDAGVLPGVDVIGASHGLEPNDLTVTRPSITITGLDATPVKDAINAVPAVAAAQIHLRVPPGMDPQEAQDALVAHVEKNRPWNSVLNIERGTLAAPFEASTSGPALGLLSQALAYAYETEETASLASGGSIPLCNALIEQYPEAELALFGIEEPQCRIHSADESVDPSEIEHIAVAELLFLAALAEQVSHE